MQSGIFRKLLLHWYSLHKRELPWRDICDPYRIWISEIILQQTRIAQGLDYYERFLKRFPDVLSLAAAAEDEVLKLWEGLGYYSRARNLHAAAREIALAGAFPTSYEGVRALKGVGDYTAAAICSFAYHQQVATVDGNVYRVLSRIFGIEVPIDTTAGKRHFKELAQQLLDPERPADFNQALMDFGSLQCTPTSPLCDDCPFRPHCVAGRSNSWQLFPVKSKRTAQQHFYFTYVLITHFGRLLIHRIHRRPHASRSRPLGERPLTTTRQSPPPVGEQLQAHSHPPHHPRRFLSYRPERCHRGKKTVTPRKLFFRHARASVPIRISAAHPVGEVPHRLIPIHRFHPKMFKFERTGVGAYRIRPHVRE